jgi:CubicO group peptidase (beta-lactamase class C family)
MDPRASHWFACGMFRTGLAMAAGALLLVPGAGAVTPEQCRKAAEYSAERRGFALLVMEHGKVVFEAHQRGSTPATRHKIFSGTKAFWVMAVLAAASDGILELDEPAAATLSEWGNDSRKRRITIRQLLNCTSGLEEASWLHRRGLPDRNASATALPTAAEPGGAFIYGPSHYQVLGEILRRKLAGRGQTPIAYLKKRVLAPLGLKAVEFLPDQKGQPLLATGFELSAREWARLGVLIQNGGRFNGRRIVPAPLLEECFRGSPVNRAFGLGFWLNSAGNSGREADIEDMLERPWQAQNWERITICRDAPEDLRVSLGSGYQRLYVIPSRELIIVRQGMDAPFSDAAFLRILLSD